MDIQSSDNISVSYDGPNKSLMIKLDRPDKKNAINLAMYAKLTETLRFAKQASQVRSVILTGGESCFTSGNDLADFANATDLTDKSHPIYVFMQTLASFPKPVIACVSGDAVGIGTTLLLHCDLIFCHPRSQFKMPFVNLGLCPEYAASMIVPALVGLPKATEWLMLGAPFSAVDAQKAGLVNHISDTPQVQAIDACKTICALPPAAVRQTKSLLKQPNKQAIDDVIHEEIKHFVAALKGPEFSEAVTAFFEKRQPDFSHFD